MDRSHEENFIEAFSHGPEGHYFDRKSARKDTEEIAKHIMAFANAGGGTLVAGIEDDGTVTGFKREGAHGIEAFEQAGLTSLSPSPRVSVERIEVTNAKGDDDHILVMDIACSETHVVRRRKDGKVALREGDRSVWLDYGQIRTLEYDKGEHYFESEIVLDAGIDEIDREALSAYRQALGTNVGDEKILRSLGALKGSHLTNAGMMLFGKNPSITLPQARFRVLKIDGTEMGSGMNLNVVKDRTFDGPFVKTIPEARDFIASQLREYQFQEHGTMKFVTVHEYPEYPWFEGLINAITHRDYSIRGEYIRVYIFDDRMVVQSPGKLPNMVTLDNIRQVRFSRNPIIARTFTAFNWVRELNEGVDKIYREMDEAGLPEPEYVSQDDYYLKLTLRNNLAERIPRLRDKAMRSLRQSEEDDGVFEHGTKIPLDLDALASLSKNEIAAIRLAAERGRVTTKGLAESRSISTRTASAVLKGLTERKILSWRGKSRQDPHQYYEITPKNLFE